jgi:hypothetical protein
MGRSESILDLRAKTSDGLKIQARAVAMATADLFDGPAEKQDHERKFIESACAFLGMDAKAIALGL